MSNAFFKTQQEKIKYGLARPKGYPKTQIKKIGVIGAGLMGNGISLVSSFNGIEVILLDKTEELAKGGLLKINRILESKIDRYKISPKRKEQILRLINVSDDFSLLKDCDLFVGEQNLR